MKSFSELSRTEQIVITNVLDNGGAAFGITPDREDVFISRHLYRGVELEIGGIYEAIIIPNSRKTPWQAIKISQAASTPVNTVDDPRAAAPVPLRDRIMTILREEPDCFFTVRDVMEALDLDLGHSEVLRELDGLHALSFICKAEVYGQNNRKRPSFNLYSVEIEAFETTDIED